jgi:hypothetical protein
MSTEGDLSEFEAALQRLSPAPCRASRDVILMEAGRRQGRRWRLATSAGALAALFLAGASYLRPPRVVERVVYLPAPPPAAVVPEPSLPPATDTGEPDWPITDIDVPSHYRHGWNADVKLPPATGPAYVVPPLERELGLPRGSLREFSNRYSYSSW